MPKSQFPFHLAIPVSNLEKCRRFYGDLLGCREGRSADRWIDFEFFGHQLSLHLVDEIDDRPPTNPVDGDRVPARHFGVVLTWERWHQLVDDLRASKQQFLIAPRIRFQGQAGEQATFFILDPSNNALEFKSFRDPDMLFARE